VHEAGVRLGADPEELHKQRVATRRLRSLLRSTRSQLADPTALSACATSPLAGRPAGRGSRSRRPDRLPGRELGTIEEAGLRRDPRAVDAGVGRPERRARRARFPRYRQLVAELEWPPASATASAWHRGRRGLRTSRNAAKRLGTNRRTKSCTASHPRQARRYAAEAVGRVPFVARAKEVQDVLGEHQDAVVAEERLRELVAQVRGTGRTASPPAV
jgi:CHAD domain-containing protein